MPDKKHVKLFIATPAFGHQVTTNYANSLLKFVSTSHPKLAVSSAVHLQSGMALVIFPKLAYKFLPVVVSI